MPTNDNQTQPLPVTSITVARGRADMEHTPGGGVSFGPDGVKLFRLLTIKQGMKLEKDTGMRLTSRAPSCFTIARKEFGLRGSKEKIYADFCALHGLDLLRTSIWILHERSGSKTHREIS